MPCLRPTVVTILALLLAPLVLAQFPSPVNNDTRTPVPGSGHDYIKMLTEIVDPSSGSLSVRISTPVSPSRGITIPFSFDYSSGAVQQAQVFGTSGGVTSAGWGVPTIVSGVALTSLGWSYRIPELTANQKQVTCQTTSGPLTTNVWADYIFTDPSGSRHNLQVAHTEPLNPDCNYTVTPAPFNVSNGGDDFYSASLNETNGAAGGAVTVAGVDGTVYNFPATGFGGGYGVNAWLPSTIEDRNGNTVTISQGGGGSITETDTVGRSAVSISAPVGQNGTVSISGLSNAYTVTWGTISSNYGSQYEQLTEGYDDGCYWAGEGNGGSRSVIESIELPNGKYYTFGYDSHGLLSQISYPTGAVVNYTWNTTSSPTGMLAFPDNLGNQTGCEYAYYAPMVTQRTVKFDGVHTALVQNFSYTTAYNAGVEQATVQTTVYSSDGSTNRGTFKTVYNYFAFTPTDLSSPDEWNTVASTIPVEQTVQYYDYGQTNLLETVTKGWQDEHLLGCRLDTHDGSGLRGTFYSYGSGSVITDEKEYDYGQLSTSQCPQAAEGGPITAPAGPTRETATTYQVFTDTPIFPSGPSILDRPCSVVTKDSSGNRAAETDYLYDGGTSVCGTAGTASVASANAPIQHDPAYAYTASPQPPRGNATTMTKQCFNGTCAGGNPISTYTYDETGQVLSMTDPRGNQTTYSYADSYSSGTPPGPTNAYLTQMTLPNTGVAHIEKFAYAYASGELTSSTDQNNLVTTYKYVDNLARLTEIDYPTPDGGVTTKTYVDTPNAVSVETKNQIDSTRWADTFIPYDGLGQPIAQSTANGEATPWDRVDTCYDGTGRVFFSSYPYQVTASTTAPNCTTGVGDTMTYDSLGRTTQVSRSDGNTILTSYSGRATQVQDEGNGTHRVQRVSQVDGLGRLASVCELTSSSQLGNGGTPAACGQDISATGFLTSYSYNALGDLLSVSQGTLSSRNFSYDSLSRLTSAANPESGTITYDYDADTNCSFPNSFAGLLVSRVDARSVRTCFQYDALNRTTQKNYSDGTPIASFNYDQTSAYGVSLLNTTGRLTSQSTSSPNPTAEIFSYDQLGRVKINSQCTPQNCSTPAVFPVTYTYDLLGDTLTSTNGVGVTLTYAVNVAPRLSTLTSSLSDSNHPGMLLSSAHYNAAGSLLSATLGGSVSETRTYDARLRLGTIADGSNYSVTIPSSGGYAPNSDVLSANDSANGNWTYTYDDFNRLASANATGLAYTYVYDRFGNRWQQNGPHTMMLSFSGSNNRMDGYSYDAAGNLLGDGTHSYAYDAENRISNVDNGSTASYVYDANGQRVRKTTSSGSVDYLYDLAGHEITELSSSGSWNRGEVYAGGRHLATYANDTTNLIHADWLGTERVRTSAAGASCETITSLPFGDGQSTSGSCADPSPMHFTGKERDSESGLDNFGARYNSSNMGRFMSPDPPILVGLPVDSRDPQSWNAYSYVRNNPLNLIDPDGTVFCRAANDTEKGQGVSQVCDVTDAQYVNSSKADQAAYDKAGYTHFDCSCDSGADKDAWQHPNGNAGRDYVGYAVVFAASLAIVKHVTSYFLNGAEEEEEEESVVIGKVNSDGTLRDTTLNPGERQLELPNQGNPQANWAQNSSKLREAMRDGNPIRDGSANVPGSESGFLRAERNLLRDHGWELKGDTWYPPNK